MDKDRERYERARESAQRALARKPRTSLEFDERYYRQMANDRMVSPKQRKVWLQLAEELATRLGRHSPPSVQEDISSLVEPDEKE
jgi:hypothetical protein